ncbi:MAG: glycine--tRNA ligase subunit beta, partial [Nitrospira sp.]
MARATAPAKPITTAAGSECLLEIGVEELPWQFIAPALQSLAEAATRVCAEQRLAHGAIKTVGTPRRLTLVIAQLAIRQTAANKEAMGPSRAVAFDQTGLPTKAAIGFATSQGVAV